MKRLFSIAFAIAGIVAAADLLAQVFPSRPVRVIMPFPAGGPSDVMMRAIAQELGEPWKQPVLVENRPGANTLIGAELAAKLPADGHGLTMRPRPRCRSAPSCIEGFRSIRRAISRP